MPQSAPVAFLEQEQHLGFLLSYFWAFHHLPTLPLSIFVGLQLPGLLEEAAVDLLLHSSIDYYYLPLDYEGLAV